jgi:hypothetical protein
LRSIDSSLLLIIEEKGISGIKLIFNYTNKKARIKYGL